MRWGGRRAGAEAADRAGVVPVAVMRRADRATDADHRFVTADDRIEKRFARRLGSLAGEDRCRHDDRARMQKRAFVDVVHLKDVADSGPEEEFARGAHLRRDALKRAAGRVTRAGDRGSGPIEEIVSGIIPARD